MRASTEYIKNRWGNQPLIVAEIGVREGQNAINIINSVNVSMCFLIDGYEPYMDNKNDYQSKEYQEIWYRNMFYYIQPYLDRITLVTKPSNFASLLFPNSYFDFVYIDADHSEEKVYEDLTLWFPKIKEGGVIAGHDINHPDFLGVKLAVEKFCKEKGLEYIEKGEDWIVQR